MTAVRTVAAAPSRSAMTAWRARNARARAGGRAPCVTRAGAGNGSRRYDHRETGEATVRDLSVLRRTTSQRRRHRGLSPRATRSCARGHRARAADVVARSTRSVVVWSVGGEIVNLPDCDCKLPAGSHHHQCSRAVALARLVVAVCGPSTRHCRCRCLDGPCDHVWDGPTVTTPDRITTGTCSRCGMEQARHDLWVMP